MNKSSLWFIRNSSESPQKSSMNICCSVVKQRSVTPNKKLSCGGSSRTLSPTASKAMHCSTQWSTSFRDISTPCCSLTSTSTLALSRKSSAPTTMKKRCRCSTATCSLCAMEVRKSVSNNSIPFWMLQKSRRTPDLRKAWCTADTSF